MKINDGHLSLIKKDIDYNYVIETGLTSGNYHYGYETNAFSYTFEYYDYGTTTVEVPEDISSALAALK